MRAMTCAPRTFAVLGDSLSAGVDADRPWPELAVERLRELAPELELRNLAVAGVTSVAVEREQLAEALALRPDLVSIVCGANDVLEAVRPDEKAFGRRFDGMLAALCAAAPDALVVTATYPAVAPRWLGQRTRRRVLDGLRRFNGQIRTVAAQRGALCLDWEDHDGIRRARNYGPDGFHPSAQGHRIAAREFAASVAHALAPTRTAARDA